MLEFIVLGRIPGTHIQISFGNVIFIWIAAVLVYMYMNQGSKVLAILEKEFRLVLIYLTLRLKI
jgi:hypothetical protein